MVRRPGRGARRSTHRIARFHRAIEGSGTLARYATRLRARANVLAGPIPAACELLESGIVSGDQLPRCTTTCWFARWPSRCCASVAELDRFSGSVHETRRTQFARLDERSIALTRQLIAQRADATPRVRGVGYGPVSELSEQSLIEHEIEKTRRHIPIREMFRRAGRAIQALKPCIMMGPQAVAQYLPPGLFHFDLVVMDEASQMRPEDALGAIARGAQLVVVGDPKQLGPTSFFDTVSSDDDEIEEARRAARRRSRGAGAAAERLGARAVGEHPAGGGATLSAADAALALSQPLSRAHRVQQSRVLRQRARALPASGHEREGDGINFRAVDGRCTRRASIRARRRRSSRPCVATPPSSPSGR